MRRAVAAAGVVVLLVGCAADRVSPRPPSNPLSSTAAPSNVTPKAGTRAPPSASASPIPTPTPTPRPVRVDADRVLRDIETLAVDIGPREATSRRYARAADWVERRLTGLGYRVRRETVDVPAGTSWGVPVRRGTSTNVVAEPAGFDPRAKHRVVGAHLDTVPQTPGAEDNASGVAVLLELARLAGVQPPEMPVRFIAFAAEEPRGPGDAQHHLGSRQHVADLVRAEREAMVGMVSLDRVGVRAGSVPVCRGGAGGARLQRAVRAVGSRADVMTRACENRTSDRRSYEKAGRPAVRVGSIPYPAYHSRADLPSVVSRDQLGRVGRLVWTWLR